jgi:hypothetical protein
MPPKTARIKDPDARQEMEAAGAALKAGDYHRVVVLSANAYANLLRANPEMLQGANQLRSILFFPRLGAHLVVNAEGRPEVRLDREQFAFSEAVTYFEFAVDCLVKQGA